MHCNGLGMFCSATLQQLPRIEGFLSHWPLCQVKFFHLTARWSTSPDTGVDEPPPLVNRQTILYSVQANREAPGRQVDCRLFQTEGSPSLSLAPLPGNTASSSAPAEGPSGALYLMLGQMRAPTSQRPVDRQTDNYGGQYSWQATVALQGMHMPGYYKQICHIWHTGMLKSCSAAQYCIMQACKPSNLAAVCLAQLTQSRGWVS